VYLGEDGEILNIEDADAGGLFYITPENSRCVHALMWSNLSDYPLDAAIFRISIE
jgi:hypothetical protein